MKLLLTPSEAAEVTGRDYRTLRRWVVDEAIPGLGLIIEGRVYIRRTELAKLLGVSELRLPDDVPAPD